jgi:DNA-binding response OmpR family regulator
MAAILVIDDNAQLRLLMRRILAGAGHAVVEAADGDQGLAQFRVQPFEIVVSDILMPNKEGIETIKELRALAPTLWIVATSGGGPNGNMMFLDFAKALGADMALPKPFRADELIAAIDARKQHPSFGLMENSAPRRADPS